MKYAFIQVSSQEYEVRKLCQVLQVSASGYYAWRSRLISHHARRDRELLVEIKRVHVESRENYGAIKTWRALKAQQILCGKHRVARLRKEHGIRSRRRKRFRVTTQSRNTKWIAPNKLERQFRVDAPNQVWVGDVTFLATRRGTLYLSTLLDLYSRKVIGWSMSNRNNSELVGAALEMAVASRNPRKEVLHHTDRGSVYGSEEYRKRMNRYGLVPSMSRKGDCYDNAVAESFFSTLKNELIYGNMFESTEEVRKEVFRYIELFYNRQRIHQTLNYLTPEQAEMAYMS